LLALVINRLHALPLHRGTLRQLRHVHDLLLALSPIVVFWFLGWSGPALLRGGDWSSLAPGWWIYIAVCAFGTVGLAAAALRWNLRRLPQFLLTNHSRTIDVAKVLGRKPVGDGPYRVLTRIPGNEAFRVEISEKEYHLPRLPREWDGLSILQVTDTHFLGTIDRDYYEYVMERGAELRADIVVFTGDLLDDMRFLDWLPATLGKLFAPLGRFFILGNHDWDLDPERIRAAVEQLGWQNVASRVVEIEHRGHRMAIGGTERPWMGEHPNFASSSPGAFRLLLSHTPDHFEFARNQCVDLMLSGHNHGGQVVLPILGPIYGPSRFGVKYAGGVFWQEPTLLYVSRGLSGQHPLRWNCTPELTKLVLRAR